MCSVTVISGGAITSFLWCLEKVKGGLSAFGCFWVCFWFKLSFYVHSTHSQCRNQKINRRSEASSPRVCCLQTTRKYHCPFLFFFLPRFSDFENNCGMSQRAVSPALICITKSLQRDVGTVAIHLPSLWSQMVPDGFAFSPHRPSNYNFKPPNTLADCLEVLQPFLLFIHVFTPGHWHFWVIMWSIWFV